MLGGNKGDQTIIKQWGSGINDRGLRSSLDTVNGTSEDLDANIKRCDFASTSDVDVWVASRLSFVFGATASAFASLSVMSCIPPQNQSYNFSEVSKAFPVFRFSLIATLAAWLAAGCIFVFDRHGIDFAVLLRIPLDIRPSAITLLNLSVVQTGLWMAHWLLFYVKNKFDVGILWSDFYVLSLVVSQTLAFVLTTTRRSRQYLASTYANVVFVSWRKQVTFQDTFFADLLTSGAKLLKDFVSSWRYLDLPFPDVLALYGFPAGYPANLVRLLSIVPHCIRILQCARKSIDAQAFYPHGINGGKYFVTVFASLLPTIGAARWIQISAYSVAMLCAVGWDLVMGFGLVRPGRKKLLPDWVYVAIVLVNTSLRAAWSLPFTNYVQSLMEWPLYREGLTFMLIATEFVRRAAWSIVRIENEQAIKEERSPVEQQKIPQHSADTAAHMRQPRMTTRSSCFAFFGRVGICCSIDNTQTDATQFCVYGPLAINHCGRAAAHKLGSIVKRGRRDGIPSEASGRDDDHDNDLVHVDSRLRRENERGCQSYFREFPQWLYRCCCFDR